jgi:hypothetical protein
VTEQNERQHLSPTTLAALALLQGLLPAMTAIVGGIWIAYVYIHDGGERALRENTTRLIEARQPFLQKKLQTYIEAAEVVGKMVVVNPDTTQAQWYENERHFFVLSYSLLSLVEDDAVRRAERTSFRRAKNL